MKYIVCHYSEISLKGGNRRFFEDKLIRNIKRAINCSFFYSIKKFSGRILIELTDEGEKNKDEITSKLEKIFGIYDFMFSEKVPAEMSEIQTKVLNLIKKEKGLKFKVASKRSDKSFPMNSQEINEKIGEIILKNNKQMMVDLTCPEIVCFIEIVQKEAFISFNKIKGLDGLPMGTGNKVVSLVSGGIDSPVASYYAMSRGMEVVFVHFHSYPETSISSINKVKDLVSRLSVYQGPSKVYFVPFAESQKEIVLKTKPSFRIILYRRLMLEIVQTIMEKERALAVVTGESLGQVASQTIENIKTIQSGFDFPIIRPLICFNKEAIVAKAQEIETYNISIQPHDDCCVRFMPKKPETKSKIKEVLAEESRINTKCLVKDSLEKTTIEIFR